jgi:hypothetical protein
VCGSDEPLVSGVARPKVPSAHATSQVQAGCLSLRLWSSQAFFSTSEEGVFPALNAATTEPPLRRSSNTSAPCSNV